MINRHHCKWRENCDHERPRVINWKVEMSFAFLNKWQVLESLYHTSMTSSHVRPLFFSILISGDLYLTL